MEMTNILKKHFEDVEAKIGGLPDQVKEALARLDDLEQKAARGGGGGGRDAPKSWGEQFTEGREEALEGMGKNDRLRLELKTTLTSATTDSAGSVGDLIVPQRDEAVIMPQRRLTVRSLLTVGRMTTSSVEYPKQTGRTNNAAPAAEGTTKPESDMKFDLVTTRAKVIAHWTKASKQVLSDIPQLRDIIDTELRYGLALEEEDQLLNGDGSGENLNGMVTQATAYSPPFTPDMETPIDTIGLMILQAALTNVPPDGIVMNPVDWWRIRLTKNGDGDYILGDPLSEGPTRLFGLPVVPTEAMTVDKVLVGSFRSQKLWDRWEASVEAGYNGDDWTKNLVTLLAEQRLAFAARRPDALIYGDLGFVS